MGTVPDYDASSYPPFAVTVDLVVLTVRDDELQALVVRRGSAPYEGRLALPGGFVHADEDIEAAARRELAEETGLGPADATPQPGWYATPLDQRLALMKVVQARQDADALRRRIVAFLAADAQPELCDIQIIRSVADLHSAMPPYVSAFLADRLR